MPGLDLNQVSSNWKRLQEQLQAAKKQEPHVHNLKRKRVDEKKKSVNGFKKTKLSNGRTDRQNRGGKMGTTWSKNAAEGDSKEGRQNLATEHGIAAEDISAAYGTTTTSTRKYVDGVNGGLHSTHTLGKYMALDCEMVGTGPPPHDDNVLARVSVVNFHGEQIYDSYVLPPPGVIVEDYRTFVSGIRPPHLIPGYARPFTEVQKDLASLLDDRILVGHALRNDFQALLLSHPKRDIRDTSRHPKFRIASRGKPPALRHLAKAELGMDIQGGEHSSIEDARATMMLYKKEKAGFEEENRKRFGQRAKSNSANVKKATRSGMNAANDRAGNDVESIEGESEEDDLELLDGEEDVEVPEDQTRVTKLRMPAAKKKRQKKRTKRK